LFAIGLDALRIHQLEIGNIEGGRFGLGMQNRQTNAAEHATCGKRAKQEREFYFHSDHPLPPAIKRFPLEG
jgi:hypothetical protein